MSPIRNALLAAAAAGLCLTGLAQAAPSAAVTAAIAARAVRPPKRPATPTARPSRCWSSPA